MTRDVKNYHAVDVDPAIEMRGTDNIKQILFHKPTGHTYICKHCKRPFKTMDSFTRHLTDKHGIQFHSK